MQGRATPQGTEDRELGKLDVTGPRGVLDFQANDVCLLRRRTRAYRCTNVEDRLDFISTGDPGAVEWGAIGL